MARAKQAKGWGVLCGDGCVAQGAVSAACHPRAGRGCHRGVTALGGLAVAASLAACSMQPAAPEVTTATVAEAGATHPTAAVDPASGAVYVAWVGTPDADGRADVYLARSDDGGASYAAPVRVNDIPGDAAPHAQAPAQVAVGPDGTVYVVWQNNTKIEGRRFPASDLRLARSTDGGRTFEPAVYVNDDAGGPPASHTFHDVAVLPDGTVRVAGVQGRAGAAAEAATHPAGHGGASPAAAGGPAHHGGQGAPDEPSSQIRVARSLDGGRTFGPSVVEAEQACPCCRTSLAVGPAGEVYLAWRAVFAGSIRDIVVARSDDGGRSFRPAIPVHDDGWRVPPLPPRRPVPRRRRRGPPPRGVVHRRRGSSGRLPRRFDRWRAQLPRAERPRPRRRGRALAGEAGRRRRRRLAGMGGPDRPGAPASRRLRP